MTKNRIDPYIESKLYGKVEKYKELYKKIQKKLVEKGYASYSIEEIVKNVVFGNKQFDDKILSADILELNRLAVEIENVKNHSTQKTEVKDEEIESNFDSNVSEEIKDEDFESFDKLKKQLNNLRDDIAKYLIKKGYSVGIVGMVIESLTAQMHLDSDEKLNDMILDLIELENKIFRIEEPQESEQINYY